MNTMSLHQSSLSPSSAIVKWRGQTQFSCVEQGSRVKPNSALRPLKNQRGVLHSGVWELKCTETRCGSPREPGETSVSVASNDSLEDVAGKRTVQISSFVLLGLRSHPTSPTMNRTRTYRNSE